ncbi:type II toxin-antitoxin system death-on-curing family toxin [Patescibacteria group bacterium]|nr:type II toxin-antitoxin system death-on-curing family toxin [Patescibacteria group bacterium]
MKINHRIITPLSLKEVEYTAFSLARELMTYNEPIPDFSTRYPQKLESCLIMPFQKFSNKYLYEGFIKKAAILFYLMIKNHPFQNGNKRIAMTTLLVFLYKNKKWLKADTKELYNFAMWVTQSPPDAKNETVKATENFIKKRLVDLRF